VSDEAAFKKEADDLFLEWDRHKRGQLSLADVAGGLKRLGMQIGLPPPRRKQKASMRSSLPPLTSTPQGLWTGRSLRLLLRALLLSLANQLQKSPVVVGTAVSNLEKPGPWQRRLMDGTDLLEALKDDKKISEVLSRALRRAGREQERDP